MNQELPPILQMITKFIPISQYEQWSKSPHSICWLSLQQITDPSINHLACGYNRGADKSLARPDQKNNLKSRHFSSDAEVIAAAETSLDGQLSDFFLSGLQK